MEGEPEKTSLPKMSAFGNIESLPPQEVRKGYLFESLLDLEVILLFIKSYLTVFHNPRRRFFTVFVK